MDAGAPDPGDAPAEAILAPYAREIDALKQRGGYVTADVIDVKPDTPNLDMMLAKFSREHWHDEDEVRFIIEGRGLFHVHPQGGPVFAIEGRGRRSDPRAARHASLVRSLRRQAHPRDPACSRTRPAGRRTTPTAASTRASSRSASARPTSRAADAVRAIRVLLLDIEGTTTPIAFVTETLFPYARARLAAFLAREGRANEALAFLADMDRDSKSTELKALQGRIWEDGYRSGELTGDGVRRRPARLRALAGGGDADRDLLLRQRPRAAVAVPPLVGGRF
jgi:hypothetical protein